MVGIVVDYNKITVNQLCDIQGKIVSTKQHDCVKDKYRFLGVILPKVLISKFLQKTGFRKLTEKHLPNIFLLTSSKILYAVCVYFKGYY